MKPLCASVSAFVLGLALVLSCSDDSPGDADAAVCDCPAGEPPISAQRLVRETATANLPTGVSLAARACSRGIAISGFCELDPNAPFAQMASVDAGLNSSNGWQCRWRNDGVQATTGTATVVCLVPAE